MAQETLNTLILEAFNEAEDREDDVDSLDIWQIIDSVKQADPSITALDIKMAVDRLEADGTLMWDASFEGDKLYVLSHTPTARIN